MIRSPKSISREPDGLRDLPDFKAPPLNEVVLSIQFAALSNLKTVHFGLLWQLLRSRYPNVTEQAPIQTVFETFGTSPQVPQLQIQTLFSPPLPRYWFERPDSPDLLQVQHDRIVHNWRQQVDDSRVYPRYEAVKRTFEEEIRLVQQWLSQESIGDLRPNQCEVTYINLIAPPGDEVQHSRIERVTPVWRGTFSEKLANDLERVSIQMTFLFSHQKKLAGRVYVNFQPVLRTSDDIPVFKLEITARGRPQGETISDALAFLDVEREQVVRTFAAVTTSEMHKIWRKTDAGGQRSKS